MLGLLAYDVELKRPGCVLLQAAMGGSIEMANAFDSASWLLYPTPGLWLYPVKDQEQLASIIAASDSIGDGSG